MVNFVFQVVETTIIQLLSLFGIFFVFGFLLSKIQAAVLKNYLSSVGWRGLLWTAWLGTPVHEYSHALMAIIFRHKIDQVVLFSPDANTGELGHVNHSYNPKSFYQSLGNFFIGLAPLIIGPIILVVLLYILVPQGREVFGQLAGSENSLAAFLNGIKNFLSSLFSWNNITSYRFWIFLYISFCIASHLAPSRSDQKSMWQGWLVIVVYLFIFNLVARLFSRDITNYIFNFSALFSSLITIYIYVLAISLIHFLLSFFILFPWRKR